MTLFDKIYEKIGKVDCEGVNISYGTVGNSVLGEDGITRPTYIVNNEGDITVCKDEQEASKLFRTILQKIMNDHFKKEEDLGTPW